MTERELLDLARQAAGNAYVPYSNFRVGAELCAGGGGICTCTTF